MTNLEKYQNVFKEIFSIDLKKIKKNLKYNSIQEWDSVGHMTMIAKLEEVFGITLEMDDIIDFSSFNEGKKILKKYKVKL